MGVEFERRTDRVIEDFRCLRENWANAGDLDFDTLFFNELPPSRKLDPRIAAVAECISLTPAGKHSRRRVSGDGRWLVLSPGAAADGGDP